MDIDIGNKELIIKTHLSITLGLLRQLSTPNRYVTFFCGHPVFKLPIFGKELENVAHDGQGGFIELERDGLDGTDHTP